MISARILSSKTKKSQSTEFRAMTRGKNPGSLFPESTEKHMKNTPIQVEIENFQSIESAKFEIRGLTVFVGKSNLGKSAVVRAISHCLLNQSVVGMVRKGSNFVKVRIRNGEREIIWEKGEKKVNRYHIDGKLYDKVERKQLEPIHDMGFGSVTIGDSKLQPWYSSQFEPIFLLDKTGPQVTNFISEISRLRVVQDAIIYSSRCKKRENDSVKQCDSDLDQVNSNLDKFSELSKVDDLWDDIEAQRESILGYESKIKSMGVHKNKIASLVGSITILSKSGLVSLPELEVLSDIEVLNRMSEFDRSLKLCVKGILPFRTVSIVSVPDSPHDDFQRWNSLNSFSMIPTQADEIKRFRQSADVNLPDIKSIESSITNLMRMREFYLKHQELNHQVKIFSEENVLPEEFDRTDIDRITESRKFMVEINKIRSDIARCNSESLEISKELNDVIQQLSEFNSCPLCGQELNSDHDPLKESSGEVGIHVL